MKGKGDQRTYWLLGEDEEARTRRTYERSQRRGSRALNKFIQGTIKQAQEQANEYGIRSSLKQKTLPRNSLTRSSSLESPKKLRFAAGSLLEHHRYHRFNIWLIWKSWSIKINHPLFFQWRSSARSRLLHGIAKIFRRIHSIQIRRDYPFADHLLPKYWDRGWPTAQ